MNESVRAMEAPAEAATPLSVWIFRTSVKNTDQIARLRSGLNSLVSNGRWNFDLEDCDNILRIESGKDIREEAIQLLQRTGFHCEELED